jgi:hypothetical protein
MDGWMGKRVEIKDKTNASNNGDVQHLETVSWFRIL